MVNREILHYWFIGWPDHGVPSSTEPVIDFLLESQRSRATFTMPGPTVVHCRLERFDMLVIVDEAKYHYMKY